MRVTVKNFVVCLAALYFGLSSIGVAFAVKRGLSYKRLPFLVCAYLARISLYSGGEVIYFSFFYSPQ